MSSYRVCTRHAAVIAVACSALFAIGTPLAAADPATDALGFVNSTARCAAPNTAVAFGSTAESRVAICKSPAGQYGYHGVRVSDGAKLVASASASADGSYVAKQLDLAAALEPVDHRTQLTPCFRVEMRRVVSVRIKKQSHGRRI